MKISPRIALLALGVVAALTAAAPAMAGAAASPPVTTFQDKTFGKVLSRPDHQVLYYWATEKKAGGKIRCFDSCLAAWPALYVKSAASVPKRIPGIKGTFGVVKRPDNGRLQLTWNGLAVYTYAHEGANQVLCNNVDGWFVVRV